MPLYERYAMPCRNSTALARIGVNLPTSKAVDIQVVRKVAEIFRHVLGQ
jgi:dTDP-4-amino-4,6-dideoxygalactose transaminase